MESGSGARSALPGGTHGAAALQDACPGTQGPARPQGRFGDPETVGLCRGGDLLCPRFPPRSQRWGHARDVKEKGTWGSGTVA